MHLDCINSDSYCEERYLQYAPDYMMECQYGFTAQPDCSCQNNYWYDAWCDHMEICEEGYMWDLDSCSCVHHSEYQE